jgi:hypothetical protein
LYLENIKESHVRSQNKWAHELGVHIGDWGYIYSSPLVVTGNTKLTNFLFVRLLLRPQFPKTFTNENKNILL